MVASGVGLGPFYKQEAVQVAPDNSLLRPIAFASKSLSSLKKDTIT